MTDTQLLHKTFAKLFKEHLDKKNLLKKTLLFTLGTIGIILIAL